jgi:pimeloyl-ACP methyl ester carboxylesterase
MMKAQLLMFLATIAFLSVPMTAIEIKNDLPTHYLDSSAGRLAYDDTGGTGPLVIAVPGMGDLRGEYRYLTPVLKAAGFRVVTVDIRGFGETSATWSDYSAHAVGSDLLRLATHLGQTKAIFIGNSFAAGASLWAAHDAPERAAALVLLAPMLRDPPKPTPWYGRAAMAAGFAGPWRVQFWLWYWDSLFPTNKPPDQAVYRLALGNNLQEPGRMDALKTMVHLSKADTAAIVNQVKAPTLIVMGTKDPDFDDPAVEAKWASQQLGAQLQMVLGAGHYPHAEMPQQVGRVITNFLRTQSRQ